MREEEAPCSICGKVGSIFEECCEVEE